MERRRPNGQLGRRRGGDYFPDERVPKRFIPTGCTLLDCILGGGWVLGRVENIVGDKSTGKTLLAIEACANFARVYPKGKIYYREAEAAFDEAYAAKVGLPIKRVDFGPEGTDSNWRTIEEVFEDLREVCDQHASNGREGLYIIDSLDALTSVAALKRKPGEGFNLDKQKILSQLFSQLCGGFKRGKLCIIIVSQVRSKIGVVFGDKHFRAGGHSLDFYASHIVWLAHIAIITREIQGDKRAIGIRVRANCKKNKVGDPFGECYFPIIFGFGTDDIQASVEWLVDHDMGSRIGIISKKKREKKKDFKERKDPAITDYLDEMDDLPQAEYAKRAEQIRQVVVQAWTEVEERFAPPRLKYS